MLPAALRRDPIPGAKYYQLSISDMYDENRLILASKLLTELVLVLPYDLLKSVGFYSWKIRARDDKSGITLGNFNNGSNTTWMEFSVADE